MKVLSAVAWPYANGPRHLGHVAGFGVPSDVFSRYMRMAGHEVLMVSGSDEHGTPILVLADQAKVTPREFVDTNHAVIASELTDLGCSYDLYTRTTTANHYAVAQELFTQVWRNGYMVEQTTQGAISPSTGRTLPDRYIEGTCPICGYGEAPPTSSTPAAGSTVRHRSSSRPNTSSSTCRRWLTRSVPGSRSARPRAPGGPTSSSSASTSSTTFDRGR
jgi:methionyl-tRNA synthetase